MASEIVESIWRLIEGYRERNHNTRPDSIYAGHEEVMNLKLEQRGIVVDFKQSPSEKTRIHVYGIPVYEVDATNHLAVA